MKPTSLLNHLSSAFIIFIGTTSLAYAVDPQALPTGGQITAGLGSINQTNNQLTVTQTSNRLITHWDNFNIGAQAGVNFQQPNNSSVALNRVAAGNPSQILGSLTANGQVFL